jgi:quinolinate synthase
VLYTIRNPVLAGFCQAPSMYAWTRVHSDVGWQDDAPDSEQRATSTPAPEGRATGDVRVLFLPDQHLGRNTAHAYGIDVAKHSCLYDPRLTRRGHELGGATREQLLASKVILWAGHCSVHKLFRPEHCDAIRAENATLAPGQVPTTILVHPECCKEVVDKSDLNGSTEFIIKTIREASPGSKWAIGTELHLVNRLAREAQARGVWVRILSDCQCLCTTMYRIDQPHLLWVLDNLAGKYDDRVATGKPAKIRVVNQIEVLPKVRELALLAIDRMLKLGPQTGKAQQRLEKLATAD